MKQASCLRGSSQQKRSFCNLSTQRGDRPVHDGMKPVVFKVEGIEEDT